MALIKQGQQVDDIFTDCSAAEELADGAVIVSLEQWREHKEDLLKRGTDLGVRLASDQHPLSVVDDLANFKVIALDFPAYKDGRAYSYARLLRDRYGYEGEIRAVGDVLLEQLHYMQRVGFDAFDVVGDEAVAQWKTATEDFTHWYQPTNDGRATIRDLRRSK